MKDNFPCRNYTNLKYFLKWEETEELLCDFFREELKLLKKKGKVFFFCNPNMEVVYLQ